jgi:flagellar biosynthesis/type III secretory pathway protein FliH
MPIIYDIESDYLYKKGFEKGLEKGYENGLKIAKEREVKKFLTDVICRARLQGTSIELIARIVSYTPEQVQEILDEMKIK